MICLLMYKIRICIKYFIKFVMRFILFLSWNLLLTHGNDLDNFISDYFLFKKTPSIVRIFCDDFAGKNKL